jgi:hypothetical protein
MARDRLGCRARTASAAVIAAAVVAGTATAQEPGPVVVSPRPELEWLYFQDIDLALRLEWRRDVDEVDPQTGGTVRDVQDRFREILELGTRGFVGHPNLLQLDLRGSLWLTQRHLDLDSTGSSDNIDDTLWEYDLNGLFLQQQKFPVTVYSRRTQSDVDRVFGGSLEQTWTETGARVNVRDRRFPTNIKVFTRKLEQEDFGLDQDFTVDQNTVEADGRVQLEPTHNMWWDFSYDDIDESGDLRATRSFDRIEGNLTHTIDFGDADEHQLRSVVRVFDQSGDVDFRQFLINERLRIRASEALLAWLDYRYEDLERSTVELRRHDASANFRHTLFDSLVTTGRFGGIHQDMPTDTFESDELDAELALDYTKRVPGGTFFGTADLRWSRVWQSDRGEPIPVVGAPYTFPPSDLIIIFEENVVESSVVITDITGTIVYSRNVDYTLLVLQDRVEIRRIPGGNIAFGETVLIDYDIGPEPGGRTTTTGAGVSLRYTIDEGLLSGLSVYTRYFQQDEDRSPEDFVAGVVDNDFYDLVYGAEYNLWKLYLKAEQQIRDSDLSRLETTWLEARYVEPLGRGSSLVLSALYQQVDREDVDIRTATTTISGTWNQQITDRLRGSLILLYQNVDGNAGFDSEAFEQKLDLTWRHRLTQVYAQLRNRYRDNTGADDTFFQTIIVGVRREF